MKPKPKPRASAGEFRPFVLELKNEVEKEPWYSRRVAERLGSKGQRREPTVINPRCLTPEVTSLALQVWGDETSAQMALSDALEESGCDDENFLNWLRGGTFWDNNEKAQTRRLVVFDLADYDYHGHTWLKWRWAKQKLEAFCNEHTWTEARVFLACVEAGIQVARIAALFNKTQLYTCKQLIHLGEPDPCVVRLSVMAPLWVTNNLATHGIHTIGQLMNYTSFWLLGRGLSLVMLTECRRLLWSRGFVLRNDDYKIVESLIAKGGSTPELHYRPMRK